MCAAEVALGTRMWAGRRSSLKLSFALLPFEAVYWIGFALPFGVSLGAVRTPPSRPPFGAAGVLGCPTSSISCNAGSARPPAACVSGRYCRAFDVASNPLAPACTPGRPR